MAFMPRIMNLNGTWDKRIITTRNSSSDQISPEIIYNKKGNNKCQCRHQLDSGVKTMDDRIGLVILSQM